VVTLYDVATRAEVSPMTVSRVMAGGKNVRQDKVDRVLAAVTELGYRRNENARSIRPGQRTGLVGVVITNVANPYYAELQLGVEEALGTQRFRLLVGNSNEELGKEQQLIADFVGRKVDGLIVVPAADDSAAHLGPDAVGPTPVVLASREVAGSELDTVLIDDVTGACEGTRQLIDNGHSRIAYLGSVASASTNQRRLDGFTQAHRAAGLDVDPALIRTGQQRPDQARQAMHELLQLSSPPTAVFSGNNRNTVGVIRALHEAGAAHNSSSTPGKDVIPVVCFDNFELSDLMPIPLAIIQHDPRDLGRHAGHLLLDRLQGDPSPARRIQLPTRLLT
jgi:LacI family transcriptional regulator